MTRGFGTRTLVRALLREYPLCDACLGRQFPRSEPTRSNAEQGHRLRRRAGLPSRPHVCWLCEDLTARIPQLADLVTHTLANHEFATFLVGASLPSAFSDREDALRARFKLRGGEPLKSELTREVGQRVAAILKRRVRFRGADVTVLLDPRAQAVQVRSRSVFVMGRYVKTRRGLPQRQAKCAACHGRGCETCRYSGHSSEPSVEALLQRVLVASFGARDAVFTWVGSEDEDSLVLGHGRPFYLELLDPKVRHLPRRIPRRIDGIRLTSLRRLRERPTHPREFTGRFRLLVETAALVARGKLREVEAKFRDVRVSAFSPRKRKTLTKRIYSLSAKRRGPQRLELVVTTDGGLNLKKFVSGAPAAAHEPPEVFPNIATVLGTDATCSRFDVLAIRPRVSIRNP